MNPSDFRKTLIYRSTQSIAQVQEDLKDLRLIDQTAESKRRRWTLIATLGGLLIVTGLVLLFVSSQSTPAGFFMLVGLLVMTPGIALAMLSGRYDLENRRYELAERVLGLLKADTEKDAGVQVEINLKPVNDGSKKTGTGKVGVWNVDYFQDPWLAVHGTLMDGTAYHLAVTEKHQARSYWKRNVRGKSKYKSKKKSACEVLLTLKPGKKRYPDLLNSAGNAQQMLRIPAWGTIRQFRVAKDELLLKVQAKEEWSVASDDETRQAAAADHLIAMMFLSLYRILNQARFTNQSHKSI